MSVMMWETNSIVSEEINEEVVDFLEEDEDLEIEATIDELFKRSPIVASIFIPAFDSHIDFCVPIIYYEVYSPPPDLG